MFGKILKGFVTITLILVIVAGILFWSRAGEARLRNEIGAQIETAVQAFEHERIRGILAVISADYDDPAGYSREDLRRLAFRTIEETDDPDIRVVSVDVEAREDTVTAQFRLRFRPKRTMEAARKPERRLPPTYPVTTEWRKEEGTWYIVHSEGWQQYVPAGWNQQGEN